ncbi:unnamed protein product [Prorocentrum cordatum]|uniref:Uncharacterized protein n=1 Tax=Prorocentrum cordatum TaxID=2364126 RepID=A0ABN9XGC2_9DINO|nr:unnamed protein product [Polarella glacialis]
MRAVAAARGALARAAARRPGAPPVAGRQGAQAGGASAYAPVTQAGRLLLARGADEPGRPPEETRSGLRGWPPAAPASRGPGSRAPGPGRTSSATGTCPEPEPRVIWAEHLLREQLVGAWYTLQMSSGLEAVRGSYRSAPFASRLGWIPACSGAPLWDARQLILCRALGAARTLARGRRALDAPCRRPSLRVTLAGVRAPLGLVTALSHLT